MEAEAYQVRHPRHDVNRYHGWVRRRRTLFGLLILALKIGGKAAIAENATLPSPFTIQQQEQTAWLIRPTGERFFSLGICCVNQGASRKEFDPANPAYAAWQHYPDSNQWAKATLTRLKAWGFTTIGGWSDFQALRT